MCYRTCLLLIKLFDNPIQDLNLRHRGLISSLVVGVEAGFACCEHGAFACAYPHEVELRIDSRYAPEHLGADIALAGVYIVDNIPCR